VGSVQNRSTSPERVTEPRYRLSVNGFRGQRSVRL
jgi:hypothetical protein